MFKEPKRVFRTKIVVIFIFILFFSSIASTVSADVSRYGKLNESKEEKRSGAGNENGQGNGTGAGNENGQGNGTGAGNETGQGNGTGTGNETGQGNGTGGGNETGQGNVTGAGNETGQGKDNGGQNQNGDGENGGGNENTNVWNEEESNGWKHKYREEIQNGVDNGTVIMETSFTIKNGNVVQENNHYQNGMKIELDDAKNNRVRVRVSADFEEGKVIVINVENEVLKFEELEDIKVYFDGEEIRMGKSEEVINATGDEAVFVVAMDSEGAQFLVYIPHFSEHIIEIESLFEQMGEKLFTNTNYIVMVFGIIILIGLTGFIYKKWKGERQ